MSFNLCDFSAKHGLVYLLKLGVYMKYNLSQTACYLAAQNGHVNCLKYLMTISHLGYWGSNIQLVAAQNGNDECLRVINKFGRHDINSSNAAAMGGHYDSVRYLNGMRAVIQPQLFKETSDECIKCASYIIMSRDDYTFNTNNACIMAAQAGNYKLMSLLFKFSPTRYVSNICDIAAQHGHYRCMVLAHQNGCPLPKKSLKITCKECLDYIAWAN